MQPQSACDRFFEIPELIELVCQHLPPNNILTLSCTNRFIYTIAYQYFWRSIDLEDDRKFDRLLTTPGVTDAMAKHTHLTRILKGGFFFLSYYFEGLMRHLDEADWDDMITSTAAMQTHASNLSILKPPIWVPDAIIRDPPTRCLPPMTRLHQLDVCFDRNYHGILFENAMRLNQPVRLLRPIAWIMDLNRTGLTHVSLRHMEQPSPLELRCIARSLSRLVNLTHLKIEMMSTGSMAWLPEPMIPILFFACPPSIVSFQFKAFVLLSAYAYTNDEAEEWKLRSVLQESEEDGGGLVPALDWAEGDVIERREPLVNLKELVLPTVQLGYSARLLGRIMEHCPAVESWDIPCFKDDTAKEAMSAITRKLVYQKRWSRHEHNNEQGTSVFRHLTALYPRMDWSGKGWSCVLNSLPEQHVETVEFHRVHEATPSVLLPMLLRHCQALRSIIFKNSEHIHSRTLAAIVTHCQGLEVFWATGGYGFPIFVDMVDAIEREWVCNGLKELRLTIDMSIRTSLVAGGSANRRSRYTKVEEMEGLSWKEYWRKVEACYRQLGKLSNLESLYLFTMPEEGHAHYSMRSFPGLMSLEEKEDAETGKRGYLSLLAGLKKLRVVKGCFRAQTAENMAAFGQREVEWIVENWPALEAIELLTKRYHMYRAYYIPEHIKWLRTEKPQLLLTR